MYVLLTGGGLIKFWSLSPVYWPSGGGLTDDRIDGFLGALVSRMGVAFRNSIRVVKARDRGCSSWTIKLKNKRRQVRAARQAL